MDEAWDIRMAREDDAPSIYRLVCELEGRQFVYDAFFRSFASQLFDPAVHCLVLEVDGRVAGYLNLRIDHHIHHARPTAEILELIVAAGERGAGLGARLVERARLLAISEGCELMEVASKFARTDAHRFYERCGMVKTHYRLTMPLPTEGERPYGAADQHA